MRGVAWVGLALVACDGAAEDVATPTPITAGFAWDCGEEGSLDAPGLGAFDPVALPADVQVIDLGVVQTRCGFSPTLDFTLPDDVSSAMIVLFGHDGTVSFPGAVIDAEGVELVRFDPLAELGALAGLGPFGGLLAEPNPVFPKGARSTTLVPNSDGGTFAPGTWQLEVASWHQRVAGDALAIRGLDSAVRAFVLYRDQPAQDGLLDVALHFSGSGGLQADTALDDPFVLDSLDVLDDALASAGVLLGDVQVRDLPAGSDVTLPLDTPTCTGSAELDALMAGADGVAGAVNIYFVPGFTCAAGPFDLGALLAGFSGGLPGVPFAADDGVLMATQWIDDEPDLARKVLAHEVGHFLGLFHTTEVFFPLSDPLSDTPVGPSDNLMYADASYDPDGYVLTPAQGAVVRGNLLVYPE